MKDRPILFQGDMVRAILENRKTQTRRITKFKPLHEGLNFRWSELEAGHYCTDAPDSGWVLMARSGDGCWEDKTERLHCPYGHAGDRLWVRETFADGDPMRYRADLYKGFWKDTDQIWTPSIFMPRWASRILLEITGVRVERVQDITQADAKAEGAAPWFRAGDGAEVTGMGVNYSIENVPEEKRLYRMGYEYLWDSINAKRGYSWDSNPWVWVIEFRRVG